MSHASAPSPPITRLLEELRAAQQRQSADEPGAATAADELARAVHANLERIAARELTRHHGGRAGALTIEPGVLADDVLLEVIRNDSSFENRRMFFGYVTRIIVRALIDHQRRRNAKRRGGGLMRVTLTSVEDDHEADLAVDVEQLPPILEELRALDPRKADVVELRVFWGMTVPEIAETLEVSPSTVDREWRFAQRWLARELRGAPAEDPTDPAT